jgi:hypothetical protein
MVMSDRYERDVMTRLEELIVLDAREHGNELSAQSVELLERIRAVLNAEEALYQQKTSEKETTSGRA